MVKYHSVSVHVDRLNVVTRIEGKLSKHCINKEESDNIAGEVDNSSKKVIFCKDGKLSQPTVRKLKRAVKYLNFVTQKTKKIQLPDGRIISGKLVFLTLTLSSPQVHSDQEIKSKLINQLIVELKKKYGIVNYVWRLEKQKNGNAHFHFILDRFIGWEYVKEVWNRLQEKLGYISNYRDRMRKLSYSEYSGLFRNNPKYSEAKIKNAWQKGRRNNWKYPNSVDIHSLQFVNDIDQYLIKYLSKDEQNQGIEGRLWGCSHGLSNIYGGQGIVDGAISDELNKVISCQRFFHLKSEYIDTVFLDPIELYRLGCYNLLFLLESFLTERFNSTAVSFNYPLPDVRRTSYERYFAN